MTEHIVTSTDPAMFEGRVNTLLRDGWSVKEDSFRSVLHFEGSGGDKHYCLAVVLEKK